MKFYMEIAAHRVCGPILWDLGRYGLSNVWATGRSLVISLKEASRPHTFDTRQVFLSNHYHVYGGLRGGKVYPRCYQGLIGTADG